MRLPREQPRSLLFNLHCDLPYCALPLVGAGWSCQRYGGRLPAASVSASGQGRSCLCSSACGGFATAVHMLRYTFSLPHLESLGLPVREVKGRSSRYRVVEPRCATSSARRNAAPRRVCRVVLLVLCGIVPAHSPGTLLLHTAYSRCSVHRSRPFGLTVRFYMGSCMRSVSSALQYIEADRNGHHRPRTRLMTGLTNDRAGRLTHIGRH